MKMKPAQSVSSVRIIVQWVFLTWIIGIGVRFGIFVNGVEQGNGAPLFSRPPGVEGFLPIGALTSLKYWLVSGEIHPVHPAALVIFLAILLMSVLAKKSFCSWLCPVGTLSEGAYRLGCRIFGRNFRVWRWLDITLRGIKYLLLIFFVKIILIDMPNEALGSFLDAPYWAVSDIKMLRFFTRMTMTTAVVLLMLTGLSLIYENFWCRYLCPYGALLGLASMASPFRVRRDPDACIGCRRCTAACPSRLEVHACRTISSPECTGCLTCVANCPERSALAMRPAFWQRPLPVWVFPIAALSLSMAAIAVGMANGHWHSSLGFEDYQRLLPFVPYLSH